MKKNRGFIKTVEISAIVVVLLLVTMFVTPFFFKDQIKKAVVVTVNKNLNAKLQIDDFGLNFFSNFPNATLSLKGLSLSGIGDFEKDTLLKAKKIAVTVDLASVFNGNYKIVKILLDNTNVYAKMLKDGRANWDIMKADSMQQDTSSSSVKMELKEISLNNCSVIYDDQASEMKVVMDKWTGNVSGDFTASSTTINTKSSVNELSFYMEKIPYLYKVKTSANASIKADLEKLSFTFENSSLAVNEVKAIIDGTFAMLTGENAMEFDLKLKSPDTQFKNILSLIPNMYTADFKDVKASGTASLDAYVKGVMKDEQYPAFDAKLTVKDGMFQYPSLPKSVTGINVNMEASNPGGSLDQTVIDISKFNFNMGGNPFAVNLRVETPISDPNLDAKINGVIDLGIVKDIYPLENGTELSGRLDANLNLATRMSYVEKEQYEKVKASGGLKVTGMNYRTTSMPLVSISKMSMQFSPQYVNLDDFQAKIARDDLSANGRLDNLLGYILSDKTLKGKFNFSSNYLNVNDFFISDDDDSSLPIIEVPKNLDLTVNGMMKHVVYSSIDMTNVAGTIVVKNGAVNFNNLFANALGGSLMMNGSYSTSDNPQNPKVNMDMKFSNASFAQTFKSLEMVQKFAPVFEHFAGTYSMNLNMNTEIGANYSGMLKALTMNGLIQSSNMRVDGLDVLDKLASSLKINSLKSLAVKDLNIPFSINNGKVKTSPFTFAANGGKLSMEGTTGLDQSIDYKGSLTLPKELANAYVNNVGFTIGGTFSNPKIGLDTKSLLSSSADVVSKKVLGTSVSEKTAELKQQASAEAAKQAQKIREDAQAASDRLVAEAEKQGQALVDKATNPLTKIAAQKASDKLVKEAKKQGQALIDQAEVQAKKVEEAAK